jgi:mycothiol synthase
MVSVRPYRDSDLTQVVEIWAKALPLDAITVKEFQRRVLLDENREQDGLLVAENASGQIVGFALCLVLRKPIESIGLMEDRGFITAFAVDPDFQEQGVGKKLLNQADLFFRKRNRDLIVIAPYIPNYFVPGIDSMAYKKGIGFFQSQGFEEYCEAIAMDALIGRFQWNDQLIEKEIKLREKGIIVCPLEMTEIESYLQFMKREMPGDWVEDGRKILSLALQGQRPEKSVFLAKSSDQIVGYCKFDGEHFGPFGVANDYQGQGIGTVLLARTLYQMRLEGLHAAFVLWTGDRAAKGVYKSLGFTLSRRFTLLRKSLS